MHHLKISLFTIYNSTLVDNNMGVEGDEFSYDLDTKNVNFQQKISFNTSCGISQNLSITQNDYLICYGQLGQLFVNIGLAHPISFGFTKVTFEMNCGNSCKLQPVPTIFIILI